MNAVDFLSDAPAAPADAVRALVIEEGADGVVLAVVAGLRIIETAHLSHEEAIEVAHALFQRFSGRAAATDRFFLTPDRDEPAVLYLEGSPEGATVVLHPARASGGVALTREQLGQAWNYLFVTTLARISCNRIEAAKPPPAFA